MSGILKLVAILHVGFPPKRLSLGGGAKITLRSSAASGRIVPEVPHGDRAAIITLK